MELLIVLALAAHVVLAILIAKIAENRGQSFAIALIVSLVFTPIIALLVIIATGDQTASNSGRKTSAAARKWEELELSVNAIELGAFVEAFPGTEEALEAAKRKLTLEQWNTVAETDAPELEKFYRREDALWLRPFVLERIKSGALTSPDVGRLKEQLESENHAVAEERRRVEEERRRVETEEELEKELAQAAQAAAKREAHAKRWKTVRRTGLSLLVLALGSIGAAAAFPWLQFQAAQNELVALENNLRVMARHCDGLKERVSSLETDFNRENKTALDQAKVVATEMSDLENDYREALRTTAVRLREEQQEKVRIRASWGSLNHYVTIENRSDYCVQRGFSVTALQRGVEVGSFSTKQSSFSEPEKDQFGFEKPCLVSSNRTRKFSSVNLGTGIRPTPENRLKIQRLNLTVLDVGDFFSQRFAVDELSPTRIKFVELSRSEASGRVIWRSKPVIWRRQARRALSGKKASLDLKTEAYQALLQDLETKEQDAGLAVAKQEMSACEADQIEATEELEELKSETPENYLDFVRNYWGL